MINITELCETFVALLCAVVSAVVIPWIKAKTDERQLAKWLKVVEIAVEAAEQIYPKEQWEKKKKYVMDYLTAADVELDYDTIDAAVEAAVLRLHKELSV